MTAARIPGTLFAAIDAPTPVPQTRMPRSTAPRGDEVGDASGHDREVDRCVGVGADVDDVVATGFEEVDDDGLEREAGVVVGDGDAHGRGQPFSPEVAMPSTRSFWKAMKTPSTGSSESTDMANSGPNAEPEVVSMNARNASGTVKSFVSLR